MQKLEKEIFSKVNSLKPDYLVAKISFEDQVGFNQRINPGNAIDYPKDLDIRYIEVSLPNQHTYTAKNSFIKVAKDLGAKGIFITQSNVVLPYDILEKVFKNNSDIFCLNVPSENSSKPIVLNNESNKLEPVYDFSKNVKSNWFLPFESFYVPLSKFKNITTDDYFKPLVDNGRFVCGPEIYFMKLMQGRGYNPFLNSGIKAIRVNKDGSLSYPLGINFKKYRFS